MARLWCLTGGAFVSLGPLLTAGLDGSVMVTLWAGRVVMKDAPGMGMEAWAVIGCALPVAGTHGDT